MTREEAIEVIKDIYNYTKFDTYTTNEARTMAIKALEQEPCDAISREEAIDACNQSINILEATDRIKDLPLATPKPKTGHWIRWYETIEQEYYITNNAHCKCSECNQEYDPCTVSLLNYCPKCGAKMERSDKE